MTCNHCHHRHLTDEDEGVLFVLMCLDCDCMEGTY